MRRTLSKNLCEYPALQKFANVACASATRQRTGRSTEDFDVITALSTRCFHETIAAASERLRRRSRIGLRMCPTPA